MAELRVLAGEPAHSDGRAVRTGRRADGLVQVRRLAAVRIESARGVGTGTALEDVAPDHVLALQFEGGFRLLTRADRFRAEFLGPPRQGAAGREVWEVPPTLRIGAPDRGLGSWILKGLEVLGVDLERKVAQGVAQRFEERCVPSEGLHEVPLDGAFRLLPGRPPDRDRPVLVFVHGTASNAEGSFGALWAQRDQRALGALRERYGTAWAFEHRTLTESPVANARALARALPRGARVHLVTHSRGGLVGELLCRGQRTGGAAPFDARELRHVVHAEAQRAELRALGQALARQGLRVERFVRVACPSRGTTLASRRLDRWLSVVTTLLGQLPGVPFLDDLMDFALAVVKERTDPASLPGLEAMMPESPLVRLLNLPTVEVDSDLTVISGDVEGDGFWESLKLVLPDLFYGGDHDLVVNTGSMFGGARRARARFALDRGAAVNHFRYFTNDRTTQLLVDGLLRPDGSDAGFLPIDEAPAEAPARALRGPAGPAGPCPTVFVVPGIMGSHLEVAANRIWLDFADLAFGGLKQLAIDAAGVRAEALVGSAYEDLAEFLAATHRVIPFPYDWRRSIVESGDRLAAEVTQALETAERDRQPIRFLAHSMGGLVVRHFLAAHPALWRRVAAQPGSRVLFLGTPHRGSHTIARLLVGQEGTLRKLAMLDVTSSHEQLLRIIARFPGALELLPSDGPDDFFATAFWEDLRARGGDGWAAPDREALRSARRALDRIPETDLELERMLYVAGRAPATPVAVRAGRDADGDPVVELLATGRGDGRVAWDTIPRGMRRWFVDAEHGDLAAHEPAFPALLELLQTGSTSRLPNTEPAVARAVEEPFVLPPEPEPMLPDEGTLAAAALGGRPPRRRRPVPATRVRVSIRHGNLAYAKHPVAVGHYLGDTIVGAEAFLDHALDGRLRRRQALGLYPGRIETCEVWVNPRDQGKPGGGIIVGLGRVGELTPGGLEASFARAALTYAATVADHPGRRFQAPEGVPRAARITSLLIGTGAENLTVRDSVEAILRGLRRANEQLDATGQRKRVVLDEIEFLELWEDRAIEGAQALADLANDPALRPHFEVQPRVRGGEGGLVRVHRSEEPGWWHRLSIAAEPDGGLRFVSLTTRARAEVRLQPNQRPLVDRFVERAITTVGNTRETAGTLFELLLPNPLKEQAPRQGRLVLVLDEQSARYPWELLEDSWDRRDQPLAVRAGLLRQLKTETFREHAPAGTEQTAFVVGDPVTEFTPLPGAAEEAAAAATLLARRGFQVAKLIRSDALSIVSQLFARPYRVLHLAGHGVHEFDAGAAGGPKVSGLVLGNGLFLTPPDVQKMRMVPELVFLNCCHLGRTDRTQAGRRDSRRDDRHRFAANLAAEFIRMGVRAVIAAGWAVDDEAARTFAGTFYDRLLDGAPFGDAVLQARSETWHQHPGVNTWGAYQCYGDPSMTLAVRAEWGAPDRRAEAPYALPSELVAELRNVASQAATETLSEGWRTRLRERIQKALERSDPEWSRRADVAAALGLAWGELGDYARAVEGVTGALRADRADLPVRALEQRASFRCRWALEQWRRSGLRADPAPLALIEDALADLDALVGLAPSVERHCLRGAAWKLRAWMGRGAGRSKALDRMADAYRAALEHSGGAGRVPLLNWLTAEALLRAGGVKRKTDLAKELEERGRRLEEAARAADLEEPGSSNSVTISDLAVVRVLAGAEPEELRAAIVEGYEEARRRGAGAQELEAVRENLEFVLAVLGKPRRGRGAGGRAKAHPAALLREVLERLA